MQNDIKEKIKEWAVHTFNEYIQIIRSDPKANLAFYTQSDLSVISSEPELFIVGINPGTGGTYTDQCKNKNWYHIREYDTGNHLLYGNYCRDTSVENSISSWQLREKWSYWKGLKIYLSTTEDKNILDEVQRFVITNASFFNTKKANQISDELLKLTIPYTLRLIEICNPKHIVFLSGKQCFMRLKKMNPENFSFKQVTGNIYVGSLEGRTVIGIPHPAYKSNAEISLVKKVLSFIYNLHYEEIDSELISNKCQIELNTLDGNCKKHNNNETTIMDILSKQFTTDGKYIEFFKDIHASIQKGKLKIRLKLRNRNNNYNTDEYDSAQLKKIQNILTKEFSFLHTERAWIGEKDISQYGIYEQNIAENIKNELCLIGERLS